MNLKTYYWIEWETFFHSLYVLKDLHFVVVIVKHQNIFDFVNNKTRAFSLRIYRH